MDHARLLNVKTGVVSKQRVLKDVSEQVCVFVRKPNFPFFPRDSKSQCQEILPQAGTCGARQWCLRYQRHLRRRQLGFRRPQMAKWKRWKAGEICRKPVKQPVVVVVVATL